MTLFTTKILFWLEKFCCKTSNHKVPKLQFIIFHSRIFVILPFYQLKDQLTFRKNNESCRQLFLRSFKSALKEKNQTSRCALRQQGLRTKNQNNCGPIKTLSLDLFLGP